MDELRTETDPCTGRPILVAPRRRARPIETARGDAPDACPFCPGREVETPPERDAVRAAGSARNGPGWTARAIPNLYPAARWHEVLVEGAAHATQPSALDEPTMRDVLALTRRRVAHFESQDGVACAFWFKNVGRLAGASIHHNHSQLLGLPALPPRVALELEHAARRCPWCDDLEAAAREDRIIAERADCVWLSPRHPKLPHETWVLPAKHGAAFLDERDAPSLGEVLRLAFRGLDRALGAPAFNAYLHRVPFTDFHWHFELQPRTGFLAGLELGGDMYINAIDARECAAMMRAAIA